MADVKPFRGIRYNPEKFSDYKSLITPPYDVIDSNYQDELYSREPHNIVRIDYGKTLPEDNDTSNRYTRAAKTFSTWLEDGVLVRDAEPALYYVEEDYKGEFDKPCTRRGFMAAVRVEDADSGVYRPHEKTLAGPKADRLNLTKATGANLSPVFSLYDDAEYKIEAAFDNRISKDTSPDIELMSDEGTTIRMWLVKDPAVAKTVADVMKAKSFLIADGHHRYETALNYRNFMAAKNPAHTGHESWNYVLMYLVNLWSEGLSVLPTHRAVFGLEAFNSSTFIDELKEYFEVEKCVEGLPRLLEALRKVRGEKQAFGVIAEGGTLYMASLRTSVDTSKVFSNKPEALQKLDVTLLHGLIIEKILGIDEKAQEEQRNLKYVKNAEELLKRVEDGEAQLGFLMNPTPVNQVKDAAETGERMPQKSTYFFPKIVTGLVLNPLFDKE